MSFLILLLACAPLKPYERAELQSRLMLEPLDPLEAAADAHIVATREFMAGAAVTSGSSCGCN